MYVHNCFKNKKQQNLFISKYVWDGLVLMAKNEKFQKPKSYTMPATCYKLLKEKNLHAYLPT